jgi:hypothetical protein
MEILKTEKDNSPIVYYKIFTFPPNLPLKKGGFVAEKG